MGSKDDDYFVQRYEAGKKEMFFAINSPSDTPWIESFLCVAREQGLRPIFYAGASRDIRSAINVDDEIRDDFYPAKTKVLYFGEPKSGADYENHWVLNELAHISPEDRLLVYISRDYPVEVLRRHGYEGTPIVVANPAEFEKSLREQIVV